MVIEQKVYNWFSKLGPPQRIDVMCSLINMCNSLELRYVATCVENLAKRDYMFLRDAEIQANNVDNVSKLSNVDDEHVRTKLLVTLALLHSCQTSCSNLIFKTLTQCRISAAYNDPQFIKELCLIFTMASHHPVFSIDQKTALQPCLQKLQHLTDVLSNSEHQDELYSTPSEFHVNDLELVGMQWKKAYTISVSWSNRQTSTIIRTYDQIVDFHHELAAVCSVPSTIPQLPDVDCISSDDQVQMAISTYLMKLVGVINCNIFCTNLAVSFCQGSQESHANCIITPSVTTPKVNAAQLPNNHCASDMQSEAESEASGKSAIQTNHVQLNAESEQLQNLHLDDQLSMHSYLMSSDSGPSKPNHSHSFTSSSSSSEYSSSPPSPRSDQVFMNSSCVQNPPLVSDCSTSHAPSSIIPPVIANKDTQCQAPSVPRSNIIRPDLCNKPGPAAPQQPQLRSPTVIFENKAENVANAMVPISTDLVDVDEPHIGCKPLLVPQQHKVPLTNASSLQVKSTSAPVTFGPPVSALMPHIFYQFNPPRPFMAVTSNAPNYGLMAKPSTRLSNGYMPEQIRLSCVSGQHQCSPFLIGRPPNCAVNAKQVSCYNCGGTGHQGAACKQATMEQITKNGQFRLTFATSPPNESNN